MPGVGVNPLVWGLLCFTEELYRNSCTIGYRTLHRVKGFGVGEGRSMYGEIYLNLGKGLVLKKEGLTYCNVNLVKRRGLLVWGKGGLR